MYAHGIQALSGGWTKQQRQVLTYDISCFLSVHKILQILNVQIVSSVPVQKIWSLCLLILDSACADSEIPSLLLHCTNRALLGQYRSSIVYSKIVVELGSENLVLGKES